MKILIFISISVILSLQLNMLNAVTLFDEKRGIEIPKVKNIKPQAKVMVKIIPLYMKLIGLSRINNKLNIKLYNIQTKKTQTIRWNESLKDTVLLKDFYKIDRVEYNKRRIILKSKLAAKCQEKKELNLLCNENNEFVLTMFKEKPIPSRSKIKNKANNFDKLAGKAINNPFAQAIKKNRQMK